MAGESTMQYYDGKFVTEEGNLTYQNIINCVPVKPPYFNSSFRSMFTQGGGEKGDKKQFFVDKRKGFTKIPTYEADLSGGGDLVATDTTRHFTDQVELKGERYFLAVNEDSTLIAIYKQCGVMDTSPCSDACNALINEGYIRNITPLYNGHHAFPFKKCLQDRFILTTHGRGKRKTNPGIGANARSWRVDDTIFSCLYHDDGTPINAAPGDYMYITRGPGVEGYLLQVAGTLGDVDPSNTQVPLNAIMVTPPGTWLPALNMTAANGSMIDDAEISGCEYVIFPEYGLTFHFVTADGIVHRGRDECEPTTSEYSFAGSTKNKTISCLTVYAETTMYIDNKTGIMALGGQGFMKFNYSPSLWIITSGLFTNIVEYMSYIVLIGPDNIGYFSYDWSTGASIQKSITNTNGYFSRSSFGEQDGNFFLIRKTNNFYQMSVTVSPYVNPIWFFTYMNNFLNTDLAMLDRRVDECVLELFDDKFWIILDDGSNDTKIMIHDQYYQLRYKRYITGCAIHRVANGIFLGQGVFMYGGETDNGNPITQIITMTRGDETHTATKKVEYVKIPFGYNSYMTETNSAHQTADCTFFSAATTDSGRWYNVVYGQMSRTDYVDNLMKLKLSPTIDNQTLGIIKSFPLGIDIMGNLGVNHDKGPSNLADEFDQYKHFYDDYPNTDESDDPTVYYVSKMGVIKVPLAHRGEIFTFELVARGNNSIEFGGFFIGYQYPDIDINRYENNLTLNDDQLTPDSGYTWTPIVTGPDQALGITP